MRFYKAFLSTLLILSPLSNSLFAQYYNDHDFDRVTVIEKKLRSLSKKEKWAEGEKLIYSKYKQVYTFNPGKGNSPVVIKKRVDAELCLLNKESVSYTLRESVNNNSRVSSLYTSDKTKAKFKRKGKYETSFRTSDIQQQSIFNTDSKLKFYNYDFDQYAQFREFSYDKKYTDFRHLSLIHLRQDLPILTHTVEFIVPTWLDVEIHELNCDSIQIKKEVKDTKYKIDNELVPFKKISFEVTGVEKFMDEENAVGYTYFEPHLVLVMKSMKKGQKEITLFGDIQAQYEWYKGLVSDVDNSSEFIKTLTDSLTEGKTTELEKTKAIFYWIQDNIRYIAFEDGIWGFKPDNAQNVCTKKYGDCKGMANLTKTMLKHCGIDARLAWVGTNRISDKYNYNFPSLSNDNHMICAVMTDTGAVFLDPTEKKSALGDIAQRIQERVALIEDGDKFILKKIPSLPVSYNGNYKKFDLELDEAIVKGHAEISYRGESKNSLLYLYTGLESNLKEKGIDYFLTGGDKNITTENLSLPDLDDRDQRTEFEFDITYRNKLLILEKEVFLNLNVDGEGNYSDLLIDSNRRTPYKLDHKKKDITEVRLKIPAGFKVQYLPESLNIDAGPISFNYSYRQEQSSIVLTKIVTLNDWKLDADKVGDWNEAMKKITKYSKDYICLQRN